MQLQFSLCIGSDLAGYDLKTEMLARLRAKGYSVQDMGCDSALAGDYPVYAQKVATAVAAGEYDRGILICGTGQGMAIAANKVRGIRAALCFAEFPALMSREHNNANILVSGAWLVTADELERVLEVWLFGKYAGAKHDVRLRGIEAIESTQSVLLPERDEAVLTLTRDALENGRIPVSVFSDNEAVFAHMARVMADVIKARNLANKPTVMIVPLGPTGQYAPLAKIINDEGISLHHTTFLNMDEYMWDEQTLIAPEHPLSFRGAMNREFYDKVSPDLLMPPDQRIFPTAENAELIWAIVQANGGVDLCVGGLGINGHVAFNEPQPGLTAEQFMALPARVVPIAAETLVINGLNEYEGAYELMPRWAVTLGFREISASKRILLGCFRPWHKMVVRKAALYPPTTAFPVTLLGNNPIEICIPEALV